MQLRNSKLHRDAVQLDRVSFELIIAYRLCPNEYLLEVSSNVSSFQLVSYKVATMANQG